MIADSEDRYAVAFRGLVCGIIEQALDDYRLAQRRGVIRDGNLVPEKMEQMRRHRVEPGYEAAYRNKLCEYQDLLTFFKRDMDVFIHIAGLNMDADAVRGKLGFKEGNEIEEVKAVNNVQPETCL